MSEATIAARVVDALTSAASDDAGAPAPLISIALEIVGAGEVAQVSARTERKTRTLLFMSADATGADGACIAAATSVHKVAPK